MPLRTDSRADVEVSVVIPAFNRGRKIRRCLDAVLRQETTHEFEVLVVDDGSSDDTAQVVSSYEQVRLLRQSNRGPSVARNHGARQARGPLLVFTDDDCEPETDWLDQLVAPLVSDEGIAGAKGAYRSRQTALTARFVQLEYEEKYDELARHPTIDFIDTYSAAFRRDVFLAAGGYDESFTTASVEDQELSFRLANAGHRMVFVPGARVWHDHAASPTAYLRKKHKIGYWKVLALIKNPNKAVGDSHTPFTLKAQVGLAFLLPPSLPLLFVGPAGAWLPLALGAAFAATTIPLTLRCLRQETAVGCAAPLFILLRAAGLSSGLARGALARAARRLSS